ncbi:MAG: tRNA (adenosine(37)-N6)-dimethylallyltransferase MiaA [Armatimonadetes bacterium]|nr:tRNA (adenosine(37)-N6)-dimethylallyltransferase MiaA [Armatimonadota bacterium]MDW8121504.1 tRNA (adenosine(37)-N6)-dimethylallyltransferase MiaA [Armatimonadota bacterium]
MEPSDARHQHQRANNLATGGSPLFVLLGPTAVGKTDVSLAVAETLGAEILSCDSVAVYRYLDIGSAKPSLEDRERIPHHLLDLVNPDEEYNVALYVQDAEAVLSDLAKRERPALIVGGTALYLSALLEGLDLPMAPPNPAIRQFLHQQADASGLDFLRRRLEALDPIAAARIHPHDRVRTIRALEVYEVTGRPISSFWHSRLLHPQLSRYPQAIVVGLTCERSVLWQRLTSRLERLLRLGWLDEIQSLLDRGYSPHLKSLRSLGYREFTQVVLGNWSLEKGKEEYLRRAKAFAKRQMTWFAKRRYIHWVDTTHITTKEVVQQVLSIFRQKGKGDKDSGKSALY